MLNCRFVSLTFNAYNKTKGENNLQIQDPPPDDDYYSETKLSDVIEVIGEDMYQNNPLVIGGIATSVGGGIIDPGQQQQQTTGYNGSQAIPQQPQQQQQPLQQPQIPEQHQQQQQQQPSQQQSQTQPAPQTSRGRRGNAFVKVIEQPATKALRFRYECEGRSAGSIPGVNYTSENKTYPTIEVVGYKGRAVVVVSCVTKDPPYRPHPHNLVGKEGCKRGVCTLEINSETMRAVFNHLGIQCVKKKDIESALRVREEIRVDPFKTSFAHRYQPSSIDLNSVRLCFQVFLESEQRGRFTVPLAPVVSDPIYDKKAMSDLVICGLCSCSSTVAGGKDIILLCEKVAKEDISVRFFEEQNGRVIWEGFGDFAHTDVHKQTAIKFKTPRYKSLEVDQPVKVFIQLKRPSDGAISEALQFDYLPLDSDPAVLKRKRQKTNPDPNMHLIRHYQAQERQQQQLQTPQDHHDGRLQGAMQPPMNFLTVAPNTAIKTEPRDTSPISCMYGNNYRLPDQSPSPQPSLSPLNVYNNHSNTPSPYGAGQQNNILISPNNQYIGGTAGVGGSISPNILDMGDYGNYQQQPQYQQQWANNIKHALTPNNNLSSNSFNVNNLLMTTTVPLSSTANNNQRHAQQQSQNHWHLPTTTNPNNNSNNNNNNNNGNSYNVNTLIANTSSNNNISNNNTHHHQQHDGQNNNMNMQSEVPTLSSLLEMDSEQLMHLNSAELSGLSIS